MIMEFSNKEKLVAMLLFASLVTSLSFTLIMLNRAVDQVESRGLKAIVNEVWEGKK